jgi:hypothetical protein
MDFDQKTVASQTKNRDFRIKHQEKEIGIYQVT